MSYSVWTGASPLKAGDKVLQPWQPVEIEADVIRWMLKRKIHLRPLLTVGEARAFLQRASDEHIIQIARRLSLSGSHEGVRAELLARIGEAPVEQLPEVVTGAPVAAEAVAADAAGDEVVTGAPVAAEEPASLALDARRSLVYEMRQTGETWKAVADTFEISETTARKDFELWAQRVEE